MRVRNFLVATALVAGVMVFAGCNDRSNDNDNENNVTTPNVEDVTTIGSSSDYVDDSPVAGVSRGVWNGDVYTNAYLDMSFTLPEGWNVLSDAEVAALLGLGLDFFEFNLPGDADLFTDIYVQDPNTGNNVQIIFERLHPLLSGIPTDVFVEFASEGIEDIGGTVDLNFPITRIGSYDWHSFGTELSFSGTVAYGRQFINIQDDIIRYIIITYFDDVQVVDDVLNMFN
ncbi:MAG: hypothetical protein FWE33_01800 [Defluviitaleaceae bacterium]|nr:hypothetical protein [Defluviitaleaceae bacterium]